MSLRRLVRSTAFGVLTSVVLGAFGLAAGGYGFVAFLTPGILLQPVFGRIVPDRVVYWAVPEGGGLSFVLEALVGAVLLWTLLFASLHGYWSTRRQSVDPNRCSKSA